MFKFLFKFLFKFFMLLIFTVFTLNYSSIALSDTDKTKDTLWICPAIPLDLYKPAKKKTYKPSILLSIGEDDFYTQMLSNKFKNGKPIEEYWLQAVDKKTYFYRKGKHIISRTILDKKKMKGKSFYFILLAGKTAVCEGIDCIACEFNREPNWDCQFTSHKNIELLRY